MSIFILRTFLIQTLSRIPLYNGIVDVSNVCIQKVLFVSYGQKCEAAVVIFKRHIRLYATKSGLHVYIIYMKRILVQGQKRTQGRDEHREITSSENSLAQQQCIGEKLNFGVMPSKCGVMLTIDLILCHVTRRTVIRNPAP